MYPSLYGANFESRRPEQLLKMLEVLLKCVDLIILLIDFSMPVFIEFIKIIGTLLSTLFGAGVGYFLALRLRRKWYPEEKVRKSDSELKILLEELRDMRRHFDSSLNVLTSIEFEHSLGPPACFHFTKIKVHEGTVLFDLESFKNLNVNTSRYLNRLRVNIRNRNLEAEHIAEVIKGGQVDLVKLREICDYFIVQCARTYTMIDGCLANIVSTVETTNLPAEVERHVATESEVELNYNATLMSAYKDRKRRKIIYVSEYSKRQGVEERAIRRQLIIRDLPTTMEQNEHVLRTIRTYDQIAPLYSVSNDGKRRKEKRISMDIFMKYTVDHRGLADPKILVPACGLGDDSVYLTEIGCHVHSFDLSEGMLSEARRADANGIYFCMDLRSIDTLQDVYDGVWARGCLYHLTPAELHEWFQKCFDRIAPDGILYFTLKDGIGEELLTTPSRNYSGGERARMALQGERYYAYYRPCETKNYFDPYFQVLRMSQIEGSEPAFEYWLRRRPQSH